MLFLIYFSIDRGFILRAPSLPVYTKSLEVEAQLEDPHNGVAVGPTVMPCTLPGFFGPST